MADIDLGKLRRWLAAFPLILLAAATVLAVVSPEGADLAVTAVLVAVTAAWISAMYAFRGPEWTSRPGPMLGYVAGQHVLACLLMAHQPIFFVFAVTGFVQAYDLLPVRWAFASVGVTSVAVNTIPGGLPDTPGRIAVAVVSVALQTTLIAWFGHLSKRFDERSEQRKRLAEDLRAALAENEGLHAQLLVQAREAGVRDERERMAREIHDTLAQGFTGIVTQLQAADRVRELPERREWHLDQVRALAKEGLASARRSVAALQPVELDEARLPAAVRDHAARWSRLHGVPVRVRTEGDPVPLQADVEIALFRVAQEALANAAKHAGASEVEVVITYRGDMVLLDVRDDGAGFAPDAVAPSAEEGGFGLTGLRRRLDRALGSLTVSSAPGEGTLVHAAVPAIPREVHP